MTTKPYIIAAVDQSSPADDAPGEDVEETKTSESESTPSDVNIPSPKSQEPSPSIQSKSMIMILLIVAFLIGIAVLARRSKGVKG